MNDQLKEIADYLKDRELFPEKNAAAKETLDAISRNEQLNYYKQNAEENYITTPLSVLRYVSELEKALGIKQ